MTIDNHQEPHALPGKIVRSIFGAPKYLKDPHLFHKMALIPVLAWVGLGTDGLSSSTTDVVESAVDLCKQISEEFPRSTVFTGQER
ncbi:MAG: hypothetical protein WCL71_11875 [Deltaproteobacteria bacterium]